MTCNCIGAWGVAVLMSLAYICFCLERIEERWAKAGIVLAMAVAMFGLYHMFDVVI